MKQLLFIPLLFFISQLQAQEISETLIIDNEVNFCKPGVHNKSPGKGLLIDYRYQPNFTLGNSENPTTTVGSNTRFNSKLKIPLVVKPGFKLLLGFQYMVERYNFENSGDLESPLFDAMNGTDLKTTRAAFYISKPLNHKFYTSFRIGVSYSGDYNRFTTAQHRYATYRAVGVFGIKKREDLEYGFGFLYSNSFRRVNALPFGFYNRTFNDDWGVELAIPISMKIRRNFKDGSLLLFGPEFSSRSYSFDVENEQVDIFHLRRAAIETVLTYQQRIKGWMWMEAKVGFIANWRTQVELPDTNDEFKLDKSNGFFVSAAFFLSPPRKNKVCEEPEKQAKF